MDIDVTGVTVEFQVHSFKAARYCVRQKMEEKDAGELDWNSASRTRDPRGGPEAQNLGINRKPAEVPGK